MGADDKKNYWRMCIGGTVIWLLIYSMMYFNLFGTYLYQYYVRADCNSGNSSIWSGPFSFTMPQVATPLNFIDGLETLTGWTLKLFTFGIGYFLKRVKINAIKHYDIEQTQNLFFFINIGKEALVETEGAGLH
jgi:hypothetical protein